MAETFEKTLSPLLLTVYQRALAQFSDDEIEKAMMTALVTLKWFPKPIELIELINGKGEDQALMAWDTVLTAMQRYGPGDSLLFEDGRIGKCIELMGGWIQFNLMTLEEEKWRRAEFLRLYQAMPDTPAKVLHGRFATENAARGFLEHIPEPVAIGMAALGDNGQRVIGYLE